MQGDGSGAEMGQKQRKSEKRGTGAGITVTTDGLQERVPISSLRVKQRKGGGELDREAK